MSLRRSAPLALALGSLACQPEVPKSSPPAYVDSAVFDPSTSQIPLPNDLALAFAPAAGGGAQGELLRAFKASGGFPYDQEVPITFDLVRENIDAATGASTPTAPDFDPASVKICTSPASGCNLLVLRYDASPQAGPVGQVDVSYAKAASRGTLTIRNPVDAATGSRRWPAGAKYIVALRGGGNGVKVEQQATMYLLTLGKDLTKPENQALFPGGPAEQAAAGLQLEQLRQNYLPAFAAVGNFFPASELAALTTFAIAPSAGAVVLIDPGSGVAPLPIDLLRTDADGTIVTNPAFGAAAAGLTTLDGFSTTAMMLAQTSGAIDASTVNGANVFVYRLSGSTATLVPELKAVLGGGGNPATAGYVAQPSAIVTAQGAACPIAGGCSLAIGLQPAVPAPVSPSTTIFLPPLRSASDYAVVVTKRVKDVAGNALAKPTVAKILLDFTSPLATGGVSNIPGVDGATATALQNMRAQLESVWAALPAGTTKADVVTAYTFRTQTVVDTSLSLAAAPYGIEAGAATAIFTPSAATEVTVLPPGIPTAGIAKWYEVTFNSIDGIDKATGVFRPTLAADLGGAGFQALLAPLKALVAVPTAASVPNACPGTGGTVKCAPLVLVGHGLNGSKETLYALASALAQSGFVAAAIDFPLHGGRNWCAADSDCTTGTADGTCDKTGAFANSAGQGDAARPGVCSAGSVPKPAASRYFISANFFRTRDAFRQNALDQSALGLALARPPSPLAPQPPGNPFAAAALALGVAVDPTQIFYEGISLGSIAGTSVVATNPRITRASLSVGGGTMVDVFTNSPAFQTDVDALFAVLIPGYTRARITPSDPAFDANIAAAYLKTVNVAKWILDPADPVNYAVHVKLAPLPNLLANPTGSVPQAAKAAYGQIAKNDAVVPNPFNALLYNLMAADQTFYDSASAPGGSVPHGMLATTAQVQSDAAGYLLGVVPPTTRTLP